MQNQTDTLNGAAVAERDQGGAGLGGEAVGRFRLRLGVVLTVMLLAVVISFGAVFFKILIAEQQAAAREKRSVERVFANHKQRLLQEIERYAASNAAYINIETSPSQAWIENRFGADMARDFSFDITILLNPVGKPLFFAGTHNRGLSGFLSDGVDAQIEDAIREIRANYLEGLKRSASGDVVFTGVLSDISATDVVLVKGRPRIMSAFAIVPDPGGIEMTYGPPNILITFLDLDTAHLASLLASLPLDNLEFAEVVPDSMIGVPIKRSDGKTLGSLAWYPMSRASGIIMTSIPVLGLALLIILGISLVALRQNAIAKRRLAEREREARRAADFDSMTGFASRRYFHDAARKWVASREKSDIPFAVAYLDFDRFKQTNDMHGHAAGDHLIVTQAARIRALLAPGDLIGRIGGDEFALLTDRVNRNEETPVHLQNLMCALRQPIAYEGKLLEASCSAGAARYPEHGQALNDLTRAADIALQLCKSERTSSVRMFNARMDAHLREARQIRKDLDSAIPEGEFRLFYQPIIDCETGKIRFYEALIRWQRAGGSLVAPNVFLPVAREAGLMSEIGSWVLEQAIRDARHWEGAGVSVNVCATQFQRPDFSQEVSALLSRYRFPPDRLILEITEDLMIEEDEQVAATFEALRGLGLCIAIDDFGTGYSSLSYLHKYRFDKLKIDRSFVSRIGRDDETDLLVRSLLSLARLLGMETVGEGVETEAQRAFLAEAGCDYLQGFLYAKPAPLESITGRATLLGKVAGD